MKDVASRAGVSLGTVSNVLNHPNLVAPSTRVRVETAIRDLDFVPSAAARMMRAQRSRVIGLVVPDISNPFFTSVARGVEDACLEAGFAVILCNSDEDASREDRYLGLLAAQRVGGILITPTRTSLKPLSRFLDQGVAIALLDNDTATNEACSASVDDELGGRLAVDHLVSQGHTTIGWLAGPSDIPQVCEREAGLASAAHQASIIRIPATQMTTSAADEAMTRALSQGFDGTAVVCANDLLAFGAIRALNRRGLSVPYDMSIVGYDDIDFAASAAVPLTSVRQPKYELGHAAATMVIGEVENPSSHAHQRVKFQPQLVVRESTAPVKR
jgi:LacI family transcriptional regulator